MLTTVKLLLAKLFGSRHAKLDGSVLFSDEYKTVQQIMMLDKLYDSPIVRMPVQSANLSLFISMANKAALSGVTVLALLDAYESDASMMSRLTNIATKTSVKYFQFFNELPHMLDMYPGEKIVNVKDLLDKTNKYTDWVHKHVKDGKVVTMAPFNSLDVRSWSKWGGKTNNDILKELILYTVADIAGVHLYNESFSAQLDLVRLADNIAKWNKEAAHPKRIWITECGTEPWNDHVAYYEQMVKLIRNTINPDKIIWYRQTSSKAGDHSKFALEYTDGVEKSPLYSLLLEE